VKGGSVVRLIVGVLILVVLAVLFAMNAGNRTDLNLFGYRIEQVSVVIVAVASFILGVLYSFIVYFLRFIDRRRRAAMKSRDEQVRTRERAVKDQEKRLETLEENLSTAHPEAMTEEAPRGRRRRRRR
jgi:uncharacterized integral membrane protein